MLNKWPTAGVIAAIVVFFWGAVIHMAFNIDSYLKPIPNDGALIAALQANIKEPGLYFYPNEKDPAKLETRVKTAPRGMLTYTPAGTPFSFGQTLGIQFGTDLICALLAAFLYSLAAPALKSLGQRLLFTTLLGVFAVFAVQAPFWNWYGFPAASLVSGVVELGVGGLLSGLVFAKLIK